MLALHISTLCVCKAQNVVAEMFPSNGAEDVNIDTHLVLMMNTDAVIGNSGCISVYDKKTGKLVDRLDMLFISILC